MKKYRLLHDLSWISKNLTVGCILEENANVFTSLDKNNKDYFEEIVE